MSKKTLTRLKALILVLTAIFLMQKIVSGQIAFYTSPRFGWLNFVGVALLIVLAWSYDLFEGGKTADEDGDSQLLSIGTMEEEAMTRLKPGTLLLVAAPLILGVIVPARPLDSSAIQTRGVTTNIASRADASGTLLSVVPSERNVLDWVRVMSSDPDPAALAGQQATVSGFVYRDIRFTDEQFMVSRFTISCCVADALAIGVVVQMPGGLDYETDSWVEVTGTFQAGSLAEEDIPVLRVEDITRIEQPEQPYLYQ